MPTPDELAAALFEKNGWVSSRTDLRALAREAAKQALLEAADLFDTNEWQAESCAYELRARAEQIGKETDG